MPDIVQIDNATKLPQNFYFWGCTGNTPDAVMRFCEKFPWMGEPTKVFVVTKEKNYIENYIPIDWKRL